MNILDTIVAKKKIEVARDKRIRGITTLEKEVFFKGNKIFQRFYVEKRQNRHHRRI